MISHRNVMANTIQLTTYEKSWRESEFGPDFTDVVLGLLPQSHIYSLVVICHLGPYRGDQVILLPKFEFDSYLSSIQDFKIGTLFLVSLVGPTHRKSNAHYLSGPSDYHRNAPKQGDVRQVRFEQRQNRVHWRSTPRHGDSDGFPKVVSTYYPSTRIR